MHHIHFLSLCLLSFSVYAFNPHKTFIDRNHCPGEGCTYGKWFTQEKIPVYRKPGDKTAITFIAARDSFTALTGDVYIHPQPYILKVPCEQCLYDGKGGISLQPGDTIYVLTPIGEGHYKVYAKGHFGESDQWENLHEYRWWVQVVTRKGVKGWILFNPLIISGSDYLG
jgi:hypothetical protein